MQQCKFCTADLAENSSTCYKCGRAQLPAPQLAPFEEGTSGSHVSMAQGSSQARLAQRTQHESRQFQPYRHSHFLPQYPHSSQEAIQSRASQEVPVQQQKERGAYHASAGRKIAVPKWIMAAILALVIAGGAGVFALMPHTATPSPGTSSGATRTVSGSNLTQSARPGSSPVSSTHPASTPKGTNAMLTCSESGSHRGTFTFTGVVAGTISLSTFEACNSAATSCSIPCSYASEYGNHTYLGRAQGKIGGLTYQFEFLINPYAGSGTYASIGSTNVTLMRNNYEWESYGATSNRTSIVLKADGKTGSIRATISMMSPEFDPTSIVTVTGNWSQ